ncbi:MFS transporter [Nostoc sp. UHCC 0702]|nr:MFS transporter [Nostoc sp. UHCC 0702]
MDSIDIEIARPLTLEIPEIASPGILSPTPTAKERFSKDSIRTSLKASTLNGVFGAVFTVSTGGILLGKFLVELDASPVVFGMLSSIPMLVNLIQPLGAYLSERTTSRFQYSLYTHGVSRLLWLILVIGIAIFSWGGMNSQQLVGLTLLIVLFSHLLEALGTASWFSWVATIVPRQLRGKYFGFRSSANNLTELISLPLAGLAVSAWYGGSQQGYGIILLLGVVFGIVGIGFQYFKVDVNPRSQNHDFHSSTQTKEIQSDSELNKTDGISQLVSAPKLSILQNELVSSILQNTNFLMFLLYFSIWTLCVNLSAPFFNLYLLDNLALDVTWVTVYNSLRSGAHLVMLMFWGRLADKIGNRSILIVSGILIAIIPCLWLWVGNTPLDIWLWLPLLHLFIGANWAAIDLCSNNIQIDIAPIKNQSIYFAIAAAVSGASGALGATIGGFFAESAGSFGLLDLFALSSLFRLASLIPLIFIKKSR